MVNRTEEQIQQALQAALAELGMSDLASHGTTLLVRDGYCIGRRFVFEGVQAVLLSAENVIHLYDENGQLLKSVAFAVSGEKAA